MIQTSHAPTLRGLHLLANHPEYALTLEEHVIDDGTRHHVVSFHSGTEPLKLGSVAKLTHELLTLRLAFADKPLFVVESLPNDREQEAFLGLFGFVPFQSLPCTDGQVRRLFISPAVTTKQGA